MTRQNTSYERTDSHTNIRLTQINWFVNGYKRYLIDNGKIEGIGVGREIISLIPTFLLISATTTLTIRLLEIVFLHGANIVNRFTT
jgi:hypothetical protein